MTSTDPKTVLILGGTSDIGRAAALAFANRGAGIQLAGRNTAELGREAADISLRSGQRVTVHPLDALDTAAFEGFFAALDPLPDVVVSVIGELGDQAKAQSDIPHAAGVMHANYVGPALLLGIAAERFTERGSGTIVGVSSVAGERGRASNYVYGSAKAGFTAFLSGLRNRLASTGVHVVTVLPGFVATRMTAGMDLPARLTAQPQEVAEAIVKAVAKGKDVIYVKAVWRRIMQVIRAIPEGVFKHRNI